jgi:peroxiredoxin
MSVKVGDRLPEAKFRVMGPDGPAVKTTADIFKGKKVVLFAVPGAFTPTCNNNHLPGFLKNADAFKGKGVDTIAWKKSTGAGPKIEFLSDGNAEFAKALDLSLDASGAGLGIRSKRYAMLVEDGVIKQLNVEEAPGKAELSSADNLLKQI